MKTSLILVVEDEPDIRELISLTLQFGGFKVVQAANGEEAIQKAIELRPDLILMDVRMPIMDGFEACQELKRQPQTQDIPVVFLSAKGQDADIKKGYEVGAVAYWLKPFSPEQLPLQLNDILAKYGQVV